MTHNVTADLKKLRRRAALMVWVEVFIQAVAPALFIMLAYITACLFGFANSYAFTLCLVLALLALGFGVARIRRPKDQKIDRRIEAASGFSHRPLDALTDAPADENSLALEIWRAHQARMTAQLATARTGPPRSQVAARDPLALRGFLLLLLLTGAVIAGSATPNRLAGAFVLPAWPFPAPRVAAWIVPPGYTGQPPQMLVPGAPVSALVGSQLTIIVTGRRAAPWVGLGDAAIRRTDLGDGSHRADAILVMSTRLRVGPWWHRLASWQIQVVAPAAPTIAITGVDIGQGNQLTLHWHAADPYGLTSLAANIRPDHFSRAIGATYALPDTTGAGAARIDLSASPLHDLPVRLSLIATNAAGVSTRVTWLRPLVLPGLAPHDPTARALDAARQKIALDPAALGAVSARLKILAKAPPSAIGAGADLQIAYLAATMPAPGVAPQAVLDQLLTLQREIEAGPDFFPAQALANADRNLMAALRRGLNGQPQSDAELRRLLQAMQQALAVHIEALQKAAGQPAGGKPFDMSMLNRLAQKIAADEAAGRTAQAAREMRRLQQTLAALQSARPMTPLQWAQSQAADAAGQQLSQMTRDQAALLDRTHQGTASPADQTALQNRLNATQQALAKTKITLPGLADAGQAMGKAGAALAQPDAAAAEAAETAAIQALQKAAAALAAARENSFGIGQGAPGQGAPGAGDGGTDADGNGGSPDQQVQPLGQDAPNPARVIEQRIIQQDSAPAVPAPTHAYYHRLLQGAQ